MIKFCLTSDWHLGIARHSRSTRTAFPTRTQESIQGIEYISKKAKELGCTHTIIAGDLFHTNNPRAHLVEKCSQLIDSFPGEKFVICGNHDPAPQMRGVATPVIGPVGLTCKLSRGNERIHGVEIENAEIQVGNVCLAFRPYLKKIDHLEPISNEYGCPHKILVAHHHFTGAVNGSEEIMIAGGIGISGTEELNADLILSGHIHKPQEVKHVGMSSVCLYPGSPARFDFGERDNSNGFWVVTVDEGISYEFHTIPVRKMVQVVVDDEWLEQEDEVCLRELIEMGVEDADVKSIIQTRSKITANVARLSLLINRVGPFYCTKPRVREVFRKRESAKTEVLSRKHAYADLYSEWCERNVDVHLREGVLEKGRNIIRGMK